MDQEMYTDRGFRIFARVPCRTGVLRLQESSLADGGGPHCWLFLDEPNGSSPQLSVAQAEALIAALRTFVNEAVAGNLSEKCPAAGSSKKPQQTHCLELTTQQAVLLLARISSNAIACVPDDATEIGRVRQALRQICQPQR